MADPIDLVVRVKDAGGTDIPMDSVVLDQGGGVFTEVTAAPYKFPIAAAMEATLSIRKAGLHFYAFPVRVVEKGGELSFKFHEKAVSAPRMAALTAVEAMVGGKKQKEYTCTFTVDGCHEFVLVSGHDYSGGSNNIAYAITRMHEIWAAGGHPASSVFTLFNFTTGMKESWVKGTGAEKQRSYKWTGGWCLLSAELQGASAPVTRPKGANPGFDSISITHVYRHVENTGKWTPGCVEEFSIFSHSWFGGPIMFDTYERPEFDTGARSAERDPEDHDARFWKDFTGTNMPKKADFKAAFSATSLLKIWGCLAVEKYRRIVQKASKAASDAAPLGIDKDDRTNWFTSVEHADTRVGINEYFKESVYKSNYMWFLSQATGRPVWGGPPGTGALLLSNGTWNWMYIPEYQLAYTGGRRTQVKPYYKKELDYMKAALGWTFSPDWYLEYK